MINNKSFKVRYIGADDENILDRYMSILSSDKNLDFKDNHFIISEESALKIKSELPNEYYSMKEIFEKLPINDVGQFLKLSLFPYQKDVVKFCLQKKNGIIVLPCGSGKSSIGIDIFLDSIKKNIIPENSKGLIVVKSSLKIQWLKEVSKFSDLTAIVLDTYKSVKPSLQAKLRKYKKEMEELLLDAIGNADKICELDAKMAEIEEKIESEFSEMFSDKYQLFIANYETLRDEKVRKRLHKLKLKYVMADEVQYIKNDSTARAKALCEFTDVEMRFGATATPIQKNPLDAYSIAKFVSPGTFKTKSGFSAKYTKQDSFGNVIGSKNEKELNEKLSEFMIVKTKEEVSSQLPKLVVITRYCKLTPKQEERTQEMLDEIAELKEQEKNIFIKHGNNSLPPSVNEELLKIQANILARQTFASEMADTEELLLESDSNLAKAYVTNSKSDKIETLLDLLDEIIESGEKAAIFSRYRRIQPILRREILKRIPDIKIAAINGETSSEDRYTEAYTKFRDTPEYKVLLLSDAAAEGINLSKCKYLIELEPADSYLIQTQRRGRLERADSIHDSVFVYQLIAENSYDEIGLKIVSKKEKYDTQIIKGEVEE